MYIAVQSLKCTQWKIWNTSKKQKVENTMEKRQKKKSSLRTLQNGFANSNISSKFKYKKLNEKKNNI